MPDFECIPAPEVPLPDLALLFNRAYANYVAGPFSFDVPGFARFLSQHGVDLWLSRIARLDGQPVGFGFINRTAEVSRLASFGVVPEARRQHVGRRLLERLLTEAVDRGDHAMGLEVIDQNPAAVRLYQSLGFATVVRLLGWHRPAESPPVPTASAAAECEAIPLLQAGNDSSLPDYPELPWQISRLAMLKAPPGTRAFATPTARVIIANPAISPVRVLALLTHLPDPTGTRRRQALGAVIDRFPGVAWWGPALFPEAWGAEIFRPLGFQPEPLNQFLMRKTFAPAPIA